MKKAADSSTSPDDYRALDTEALLVSPAATKSQVTEQEFHINILEEYLRLAKAKQFKTVKSSNVLSFRFTLC